MGESLKSIAVTYASRYSSKVILILIAVILILMSGIGMAKPAKAQAGNKESVTMSPSASKFTIDAGGTLNGKITLVNDGTVAYDLLVYARPYSINSNRYDNPDFTSAVQNADLYGWVQFPKTKFHLEPNAPAEVEYTVRVPQGAAPGGHYGVIFAEIQPTQKAESGNSVLRKKRVGSIIYATVNGDVKLAGEAADGSISFWQVEPPLRATVAAKNTGNTHFTNAVQLTVHDILGKVKYRTTKEYQVLPGTTRTIELQWDKAAWFGLYRVETEQKFLDKTIKSESYVLIMPRYLPVALLVIILIGGVYEVVRRRKK